MTIEHVTDLSFETEVLGSSEPYLLDFSAVWCAPCRALAPILEEIAREQRGRLRVGKIDIDDSPVIAARLGVRGAPTVVLFRGGREHGRLLGLTSKRKLLELAELTGAPVQLPVG
ncbi:MAG TPA: thioredoxin domain-containing protein [Polyangiales bacterium]|nr:thioredoxin domain-containing protein [Polyangiales bacterium]